MRIFEFNPVTKESGHCIATGRGSTAIFLALSSMKCKRGLKDNSKVIVPANICYAAVMPVIYAGFEPVFCDVDPKSGNVTLETIKAVAEDAVAAVIPHMYGNPVAEMPEIVDFCHENEITVIEDCASLMTTAGVKYNPGAMGDYVVYSTGYSKPVELGLGGLLFSATDDLAYAVKVAESKELGDFEKAFEEKWHQFSKTYRGLRNTSEYSELAKSTYENFVNTSKDSMCFRLPKGMEEDLFKAIEERLIVSNDARLKALALYKKLLDKTGIEFYQFGEDAIPWRFNFFVAPEKRKKFIEGCLENNVPISDWYPNVTPIFESFAKVGNYPGADWHAERILNLPLLLEPSEIERICAVLTGLDV